MKTRSPGCVGFPHCNKATTELASAPFFSATHAHRHTVRTQHKRVVQRNMRPTAATTKVPAVQKQTYASTKPANSNNQPTKPNQTNEHKKTHKQPKWQQSLCADHRRRFQPQRVRGTHARKKEEAETVKNREQQSKLSTSLRSLSRSFLIPSFLFTGGAATSELCRRCCCSRRTSR